MLSNPKRKLKWARLRVRDPIEQKPTQHVDSDVSESSKSNKCYHMTRGVREEIITTPVLFFYK